MFIKTKEDFTCDVCGSGVKGTGYTNHCPMCLWSKHVDIDPGDRLASCGGKMKPSDVLKKGKEYNILHKCEKCGFERLNKTSKEDNFDMVVQIQSNKIAN